MSKDDNDLHYFGNSLPQLQIDDLPAKRAPYVEEQVAKDEYGRRRFHGAFTGGFSAGHWNTVGSQEGWQPQDYTSSRQERAAQRQTQRPEDFMDAEDLGEFGIAPQRLQAKDDFAVTKSRKRKFAITNDGPIPGIPVLEQICEHVQDKVAIRILKSMGWRPGQGVGPRQTQKQKKTAAQLNKREMYLMEQYGFQPNNKATTAAAVGDIDDDGDESEEDEQITFAPEDYDPFVVQGKENRFGIGYSGLKRDAVLGGQHFTLFEPIQLLDKTQQKKFTISGQAFGVGALEEEDEDIYAREDMTNYDFSLDERQQQQMKKKKIVQDKHIVDGFVAAKDDVQYTLPYKIDLPGGFRPRNWTERKSRFAPLPAEKALELMPQTSMKAQKAGLGRHELTPAERGAALNEDKPKTESLLEKIFKRADNFQSQGIVQETTTEEMLEEVQQQNKTLLEKSSEKTKDLQPSSLGFQPFKQNAAKQERYERFLESKLQKEDEVRTFLADIQPIKLTEWEREMEMKEFIQARKIYKPLDSIMSNRFVAEGSTQLPANKENKLNEEVKKIQIERSKNMWKPHSTLCKRYNIPEPYGKHEVVDNELEQQLKNKRDKTNIFDFISLNKKSDFQTPVIIPKHIEPQCKTKLPEPPKLMGLEQMKVTLQQVQQETKPTTIISKPQFKPQTELEKRVEAAKDEAVPQKQELFKAIFDSDDEQEEVAVTKEEAKEQNEVVEQLVKSAKEYNLLGNNSPPRGIFSAIFEAQQQKLATTVEKICFQPKIKRELEPEFYGPAVPAELQQVVAKREFVTSTLEDDWVEKNALESDSSSSSSDNNRKHKKSKHHKKHKKQSKHKKKHKKHNKKK